MITRLTEPDPAKLERGQPMELVLEPLTEQDGNRVSRTHSHPGPMRLDRRQRAGIQARASGYPVKSVVVGVSGSTRSGGSKA